MWDLFQIPPGNSHVVCAVPDFFGKVEETPDPHSSKSEAGPPWHKAPSFVCGAIQQLCGPRATIYGTGEDFEVINEVLGDVPLFTQPGEHCSEFLSFLESL